MTTKWPTVKSGFTKTVTIIHAQAWAGNPDPHEHEMKLTFGWKHEINPHHGHTWPLSETHRHIDRLCALIDGKFINDLVAPYKPTVETLACWLFVRTPAFYDSLRIDCYDGYFAKVGRGDIPAEWRKNYMVADLPASLTA